MSKVVQFVLEPHPEFPLEVHKLGMGYLLVRKGEMLKHHQQKLDNVRNQSFRCGTVGSARH